MAIPNAFLAELRAATPMAALVGRKVRLQKAGRHHKGRCCFHADKSPSLEVYSDADPHFHCFGCGAHGDAISFVMQAENLLFSDAVEKLAAEAGLDVPKPAEYAEAEARRRDLHGIVEAAAKLYEEALWMPAAAGVRAVLHERGLTEATIRAFRIGYAGKPAAGFKPLGITDQEAIDAGLALPPESGPAVPLFINRIMFPIMDQRGRVRGFTGRALGDRKPKYLHGPDTALIAKRDTLYGIQHARKAAAEGKPLVIVEGPMDAVQAHQAGRQGAVAVLGSALSPERLTTLWKLARTVTVCFDGDEAGRKATERTIDLALPLIGPERRLSFARMPDGHDPDSLIRTSGGDAFGRVIDTATPFVYALYDTLDDGDRTPEGRAGLKRRLDGAAARVTGDLRWEYQKALRNHFFEQARKRGRNPYGRVPALPPPPVPAQCDRATWIANVNEDIRQVTEAFCAAPSKAMEARLVALIEARASISRGDHDQEEAGETDV